MNRGRENIYRENQRQEIHKSSFEYLSIPRQRPGISIFFLLSFSLPPLSFFALFAALFGRLLLGLLDIRVLSYILSLSPTTGIFYFAFSARSSPSISLTFTSASLNTRGNTLLPLCDAGTPLPLSSVRFSREFLSFLVEESEFSQRFRIEITHGNQYFNGNVVVFKGRLFIWRCVNLSQN